MRLFRRTRRPAKTTATPTWRERRAAQRTARAEASLLETERRIHQIAADVREDIQRT